MSWLTWCISPVSCLRLRVCYTCVYQLCMCCPSMFSRAVVCFGICLFLWTDSLVLTPVCLSSINNSVMIPLCLRHLRLSLKPPSSLFLAQTSHPACAHMLGQGSIFRKNTNWSWYRSFKMAPNNIFVAELIDFIVSFHAFVLFFSIHV